MTEILSFYLSMLLLHMRYFIVFLILSCYSFLPAQTLEAAYSEWDDQFDEWRLHLNAEEFVLARRQFGQNSYRRWNIEYETPDEELFTGFIQLNRADDINYWELKFNNELIIVTTIHRDDIFLWRVKYNDITFDFQAEDRFGFSWKDRYEKEFDWNMFMPVEGDFRDWYIDDNAGDALTLPMRIAAAMVVIDLTCYGTQNAPRK